MHIVKDHRVQILTISDINRRKRIIDGQKTKFLLVELGDLAEVKDQGIDLQMKKYISSQMMLIKLNTTMTKQKISAFDQSEKTKMQKFS